MATVVIRGDSKSLRSAMSFAVSACFHGGVLAWVAFGVGPAERPRSLYDQEIRPSEKKIIWYRLSAKLPEIAPPDVADDHRPLRARVKSPQTMVAGIRDEKTPAPMIWAPDPPVPSPKPLGLPNLIGVAPARVLRPFVPPPKMKQPAPAPKLPDAPHVEAAPQPKPPPLEVSVSKPAPRAFVPPPDALAEHVYERFVTPSANDHEPLVTTAEVAADGLDHLDPVCLMEVSRGTVGLSHRLT